MLAKAAASGLRARWLEADIAAWTPDAPYDLCSRTPRCTGCPITRACCRGCSVTSRPGGVLAVQMPRNFAAPSHALLREVARAGPWAERLAPRSLHEPVAAPEWYHDLLAPLAAALDIWQTEYLHVLDGEDPVLNWTRSTALRPVIAALDAEEQARFEADYAARLRAAYPGDPTAARCSRSAACSSWRARPDQSAADIGGDAHLDDPVGLRAAARPWRSGRCIPCLRPPRPRPCTGR